MDGSSLTERRDVGADGTVAAWQGKRPGADRSGHSAVCGSGFLAGAIGRALACASGGVRQVEQRLPAIQPLVPEGRMDGISTDWSMRRTGTMSSSTAPSSGRISVARVWQKGGSS